MGKQFLRKYRLEIDDTDGDRHTISELRIAFLIQQDLMGFPALGKITVYNMNADNVKRLRNAYSKIKLSVGYGDDKLQVLHQGTINNVMSLRENETGVTEFYSKDCPVDYLNGTFSGSYAKGSLLSSIFSDIAKASGLTVAKSTGDERLKADVTFNSGCAAVLRSITQEYEKWFVISEGELSIFPRSGAAMSYTSDEIHVISKDTGMIGYPTVTEIGADVNMLLNPSVKPMSLYRIESVAPRTNIGDFYYRPSNTIRTLGIGLYRAQRVEHTGDTWGDDWQTSVVGRDFTQGKIEDTERGVS